MKANGHAPGDFERRRQVDYDPIRVVDFIAMSHKPIPVRRWLVPNWIPMGVVTGLYGPGGEGKTLILQQLMTSCAIGRDWLGLKTKNVKAFGVFCEDDEEDLHIRQYAINQ